MARRVLHDRYFKQAKEEGYLARSAYKLEEINQKKRLMRPGDLVLDLGCAPGAWIQVAAKAVGAKGGVVGIDLKSVRGAFGGNVRTMVGDIYETPPEALLQMGAEALGGEARLFDVVISDMAPNTSGAGSSDHFLSVRLCDRVLEMLPRVLKGGGKCAMKVFEGEAYKDLLDRTGEMFAEVKGFKPKASRDVSREMYIVAAGFRAVLA